MGKEGGENQQGRARFTKEASTLLYQAGARELLEEIRVNKWGVGEIRTAESSSRDLPQRSVQLLYSYKDAEEGSIELPYPPPPISALKPFFPQGSYYNPGPSLLNPGPRLVGNGRYFVVNKAAMIIIGVGEIWDHKILYVGYKRLWLPIREKDWTYIPPLGVDSFERKYKHKYDFNVFNKVDPKTFVKNALDECVGDLPLDLEREGKERIDKLVFKKKI